MYLLGQLPGSESWVYRLITIVNKFRRTDTVDLQRDETKDPLGIKDGASTRSRYWFLFEMAEARSAECRVHGEEPVTVY